MSVGAILDYVYIGTGSLALFFLAIISGILAKNSPERIKSRIFLRYPLFKVSMYILTVGAVFILMGRFGSVAESGIFQEIGESVHHISMFFFALVLFLIIKPRKWRQKKGS